MESGNRLAFSREIFEAGARLFHEGDPPGDAFVIESGKVEIAKKHQDDQVVVGVAGPGEMLGEMSLVDDSPRSATARASERTVALVVPHEVLRRRLEGADPVLQRIIRILIQRLRDQTEALAAASTIVR